jgi:hypothetical protein
MESDEELRPSAKEPEFERLSCDVAGCVVSGSLMLGFADGAPDKE